MKMPYLVQCYPIQLLKLAQIAQHKVMIILLESALRMWKMAFPIGYATTPLVGHATRPA